MANPGAPGAAHRLVDSLQLRAAQERFDNRTPFREATIQKIKTRPLIEVDTPERVRLRIERLGFAPQESLIRRVQAEPESLHVRPGSTEDTNTLERVIGRNNLM